MKTRTSPVVLGFIWGMGSMLLSFAVVSVFASLQVVFVGFPLFVYNRETQYMMTAAIFLLSVLGAIGSGLVSRLPKLGGVFILLSCCGVALLLFSPVLTQSFSFGPLEAYGIYISPLVLLITDFTLIVLTVIGLAGGILAFIPKSSRKAIQQPPVIPAAAGHTWPNEPVQAPIPAPAPAAVLPDAQPDVMHAEPVADINLMELE